MRLFCRQHLLIALLAGFAQSSAFAWDYEAHRVANQLALASLPTNFPAFVHHPASAERIAFLAGEPDRWRNTPDLPLKHFNGPDHYIDVEELHHYGLDPLKLPVFRYDFVAQLALIRKENPAKFPAIDPASNQDHTRELPGLLPWGVTEYYGKVKSGFSYLKTFEKDGGTPEEILNAQANLVYVMGVMGHLVGDASQPLHTTVHHHGWVGANPNGYSTNSRIHSWIDGGYFAKVGPADLKTLKSKLRPARLVRIGDRDAKPAEMFQAVMLFLIETQKEVETIYQLDKTGKLSGNGTVGLEGKAVLESHLLRAGQFLGDLWYSAWEQASEDSFLKGQLARRQRATGN